MFSNALEEIVGAPRNREMMVLLKMESLKVTHIL